MKTNYKTIECKGKYEMVFKSRSVELVVVKLAAEECNLTLAVKEGAGVHVVVLGTTLKYSVFGTIQDKARLTLSCLSTTTRSQVSAVSLQLVGEQASVYVQTVARSHKMSQLDARCTLEHVSPHTVGRITARRVVEDDSKSSFSGMLRIMPGAHGTDTYLSDKALTLGEKSTAKSDPGLEILADDVKASHGATIGRLSEEELFYLRSRGLDYTEASSLLVEAFLKPALIGVPLELQQQYLNPNF